MVIPTIIICLLRLGIKSTSCLPYSNILSIEREKNIPSGNAIQTSSSLNTTLTCTKLKNVLCNLKILTTVKNTYKTFSLT